MFVNDYAPQPKKFSEISAGKFFVTMNPQGPQLFGAKVGTGKAVLVNGPAPQRIYTVHEDCIACEVSQSMIQIRIGPPNDDDW